MPAIGRPSQADRIRPREPPRGVPVSNPPRPRDFPGFPRPPSLAFAPASRRQRPAGRERSGSPAEPSELAARAAPRGRLETSSRRGGRAVLRIGAGLRAAAWRGSLPLCGAAGCRGAGLEGLRPGCAGDGGLRRPCGCWSGAEADLASRSGQGWEDRRGLPVTGSRRTSAGGSHRCRVAHSYLAVSGDIRRAGRAGGGGEERHGSRGKGSPVLFKPDETHRGTCGSTDVAEPQPKHR